MNLKTTWLYHLPKNKPKPKQNTTKILLVQNKKLSRDVVKCKAKDLIWNANKKSRSKMLRKHMKKVKKTYRTNTKDAFKKLKKNVNLNVIRITPSLNS